MKFFEHYIYIDLYIFQVFGITRRYLPAMLQFRNFKIIFFYISLLASGNNQRLLIPYAKVYIFVKNQNSQEKNRK